jgi:hypothetical protein
LASEAIFKKYASSIYYRIQRYNRLFHGSLAEIEFFSRAKRCVDLLSLIALGKYLGIYENFKQKVRNFGS